LDESPVKEAADLTTVVPPRQSLAISVRRFGGAHAHRLVDAPGAALDEHAHDWPVLSIFVAGQVENRSELGTYIINSPWVMLYGARAPHANSIGVSGFEEIQIEFDPMWLGMTGINELRRPRHWIGGEVAAAGRRLGALWCNAATSESQLREASTAFLAAAQRTERRPPPPLWITSVICRLKEQPTISSAELGDEFGLNVHWVRQAYRLALGEGIHETARRAKVEAAATMLRRTALGAAEISALVGFCDQSHMIRCFLSVLGRTPSQVRSEWQKALGTPASPKGAGTRPRDDSACRVAGAPLERRIWSGDGR
jgi:AraC family transcriptional regulator